MRKIKVNYYIDDEEMIKGARPHAENCESEFVEACSSQEAIDLLIEYLAEQTVQNSEFDPVRDGECINILDTEGSCVQRYYNFSADSPVKELRKELGMSRAEAARILEMPVRTLEDWESGKRMPAHWAEKLVLEKLEQHEGNK